jgi:catechol 2,3-dioxygenase-like lactoylglutathione lyase family enzyme
MRYKIQEDRTMKMGISKSAGGPAVHSLDHFCLTVPDLDSARKFYTEFGLDVRDANDELELYAFGNPHRWAVIRRGARKKLEYVVFGVFEADFPNFRSKFQALGVEIIGAPDGAEEAGIWFRNLDGMPMQIITADKVSPDTKAQFLTRSVGPGECAAIPRSKAPRVHPRRLSHFLMFSSDVLRDIDFYGKTLGLKLSDRSADLVAFMHGVYGSDHHMLALAKSGGPGMHHSSWDVGTIQEVGLGGAHMAQAGFDRGWGIGQHVLGANYFHYVRDPWGSYAEYSCDIDFVPAGHDWPSADHPPEDSLYLWGPALPDDFITNYELQDA